MESTRKHTFCSLGGLKERVGMQCPKASLAGDCLHQHFALGSTVVVGQSSLIFLHLLPELVLQLCSSTGVSCLSPSPVTLLMTPELRWFDSWMLSHFVLQYMVLPYLCKTFDGLRSAFIHVSSVSACGELVRSVLLASFYRSGTGGLERWRHLPKVTGLEGDGDRPQTWTMSSFDWIPGREDNFFLFLLFWLPPARTWSGVRGD